MLRRDCLIACCFALTIPELAVPESRAADPETGHQPQVSVPEPTRLDWVYALANQSPARIPDDWQTEYASQQKSYELFVPEQYAPDKSWPVVLFISPGNRATGFSQWQTVCRREQIIFASPHEAGNNTQMQHRVRLVMDVLDDLRRRYNVDPDRTYIGGFSGGGRVACAIAFAVPEYFGGVLPVCAGGELRQESSLRQRVVDRLSVAQLTGDSDFNRGECERLHQTELSGVGVRCRTWIAPGTGHAIPHAGVFAEAFQWLEDGLPGRQKLAAQWPASSLKEAPTRDEWSQQLLDEGQRRLLQPQTAYSGLMQIKSVYTRWNDLPAAKTAFEILTKAEATPDNSWEEADVAEQRRFLLARARAVDAYGSGPLPKQYEAQKDGMIKAAIQLWMQVEQNAIDEDLATEARRRIPALEALLK